MEESKKRIPKKLILCLFLLFLAAAAAGFWYFGNDREQAETRKQDGAPANGSGQVSASGVTMIGMEQETFAVTTVDAQLEIEEVYVASGDGVEQDSPILKFTENSVREVSSELSHAAAEAALYYRQGCMDYQTALTEARQTCDTALLNGAYAQTAYDIHVAQAQEELDSLEEQMQEAKELYEEYDDGVYHQGYEKKYEVTAKKELYETNEALYWSTLKKWNIDDREINNSAQNLNTPSDTLAAAGMGGGSQGGEAKNDPSQIEALELLEDTYRANKEAYERALEDCEAAANTAAAGIAQAQASYEKLQLQFEKAQIDFEKKTATYQADRETAVLHASSAEAAYQTEQKRQKEALDVLEDEKKEAEENLALFEETVRDGCLYTKNRGTVVAVAVSDGAVLQEDDMILAYSNPEEVTVSASVRQSDIASICIGDAAVVRSEDYGDLEGVVTQINPVSANGGRTSATYTVEISIPAAKEGVKANKTVTVYFGDSPDEMGGGRS